MYICLLDDHPVIHFQDSLAHISYKRKGNIIIIAPIASNPAYRRNIDPRNNFSNGKFSIFNIIKIYIYIYLELVLYEIITNLNIIYIKNDIYLCLNVYLFLSLYSFENTY